MFDQGIEDPSNPKGRFNDVGSVFIDFINIDGCEGTYSFLSL
jgi:hypothetical protein